jgi:hypothetical protein
MIAPSAKKTSFFVSQVEQGDTLFVGEGNLSFALNIAKTPGITASNLVATTYEETSDLSEEAQQNTELLNRSGASVMNNIDATKLDQYFPHQKFDTIIFQFSNAGSREPEYGRNPNYILIRDFLKSAAFCLEPKGKILITAVDSPHYQGAFKFEEAAEKAGYRIIGAYPFDPESFPGYGHTNTNDDDSALEKHDDFKTWIFELKLHRWKSNIKLSNFYGIEIADFAAETAKLSLWIAEYQMNQRFKTLFGETRDPFPLVDSGHIIHDNALHVDWHDVCPLPNDDEVETYIVGNPPYLGSLNQADEQKADMARIFKNVFKTYKDLDYVAGWYFKGAEYCAKTDSQCAFVATNSICQGEQVAMLWPLILNMGLEIGFAYKSFKWKNLAASNAAVICVIVGLRKKQNSRKIIFDGDQLRVVENINPYLIDARNVIVRKQNESLSTLPKMDYGNKPTDGGNLILSPTEAETLLLKYPQVKNLVRRYWGSKEFIRGNERYCFWIEDRDLELIQNIPEIQHRIENVAKLRKESRGKQANDNAKTPHRFVFAPHVEGDAIIIPRVFSENREYMTVGFLDGETNIISDSAAAIYNAQPYIFSVLSSKIHIIWARAIGGRLKTDLRYSNTLIYNTFPIPVLSNDQKLELEEHAWAIIGARDSHPGKTIAWLYDLKTMPKNLLDAHRSLDDCLEKIYIGRAFKDDTERLEHLFKLYEKMIAKKSGKK